MIHICRIITRLNIGGPARHVALLARGLRDFGFRTTVIAGEPGSDEGDMSALIEASGAELVRVAELGRDIGLARDLRSATTLRALIEHLKPDIVHTHTAKAGYIGRMAAHRAGVPCIVHTYHGHTFSGYFGLARSAVFRLLERRAARISDAIVALGERQRRDIAEIYRIAPREKVRLIPLGLDLSPYLSLPIGRDSSPYRQALNLPTAGPLVAIVGRMVPIKNYPLFLKVAAQLASERPGIHFVVVGGGGEEELVKQQAKLIGLDRCVTFAGWISDMASLYATADVVLLTSRNEGSPVALIEAQAAGVPVVATDVGGVADTILDGRSGRLCPPDAPAALAEAVRYYLDSPGMARRAGELGRHYVAQEFSAKKLVQNIAQLYCELLGRQP